MARQGVANARFGARFRETVGHQIRNRSASVPRSMARRSLRPHLNQIRTWVRQGRTDAWIAHQLEVTVTQIAAFKRENELAPEGEAPEGAAAGVDFDDEIDLRAEDDALIPPEPQAQGAPPEDAGWGRGRPARKRPARRRTRKTRRPTRTSGPSAVAGAGAGAGASPRARRAAR